MPDGFRMTTKVARVLREFLEDPDRPQYGFDLMQECKLASGSAYPILIRLEQAGWITSQREDVDAAKEGRPPRRYYLLSPDGAVQATRELAALSEAIRPSFLGSTIRPAHEGGWA